MVKSTKEMGEMGREGKRREGKRRRRAGGEREDIGQTIQRAGEEIMGARKREKMMEERERERMMEEIDRCTERIGAEKWKKCAKII